VYTESQSRRSAAPLLAPTSVPTSMRRNSHGIISFADPHSLNSVLSYRYKNMGGRGEAISQSPSPCSTLPLNLLVATLMALLVSVANKRLIEMLNPLNASLTKNRGVGVLLLTRNPKKDLYPERPSGAEGPLFTSGEAFLSRESIAAIADSDLVGKDLSFLKLLRFKRANVPTFPTHTHCRSALLFLRSDLRGISTNHV
jgi:hypothetical protein